MDIRLDGRVALITGGSAGIGAGIAHEYCRSGARCMLAARNADELAEASAAAPGETDWFQANAGDPDAAEACVAATIERFGRLDILVNNAATNPYAGALIDIDLPRYDKTVQVNLRGPLVWIQQAWQQWMAEHGGVVLNIVSCGAYTHTSHQGVYGMTKAGLIHHTQHLAAELGPTVRVNAIAPAFVPTGMSWQLDEADGGAARFGARIPMQRAGTVEDIAAGATYLASDRASWVTGHVLIIDGGMLASS